MSTQGVQRMHFGADLRQGGGVDFRLWAPAAQRVELVIAHREGQGAQKRFIDATGTDGWYACFVPEAGPGTRYRWRIDGELEVPDPASRCNPEGVHGFSKVVDPEAFQWTEAPSWCGRPWFDAVMYELHVGTFTPEGSYAAAQSRLAALADLGITAVQLMPQASYPGRFGWGYDGVLPFAPQASHGRIEDLKRFIDTAHGLGLMVLMDVVYNHFGPDGNFLPRYAPAFFSARHQTAWGAAVNFDGRGSEVVREFFIQNALYWLDEYRIDGLRFDAVHAMLDDSTPDIMQALSLRVRDALPDRHIHLVLENDSNDPKRLGPPAMPGRFEGQWNGDFHHPLHVLLTGERDGYYAEYANDAMGQLAHSLTGGLVWEGLPQHGEHPPPWRKAAPPQALSTMVNFLQNHDQVGNRAFGERLAQLVPAPALRLVTAMHLLNPAMPLIFMGEEFGATTPFLYFSDWQGELRQAVTEGRRREFARFPQYANAGTRDQIPDPCDEDTFLRSKLDWSQAWHAPGQGWLDLYRELLALRRRWITPHLPTLVGQHTAERVGERALHVRWVLAQKASLNMLFNLSPDAVALPERAPAVPVERALFCLGPVSEQGLGAWSGCWWMDRS